MQWASARTLQAAPSHIVGRRVGAPLAAAGATEAHSASPATALLFGPRRLSRGVAHRMASDAWRPWRHLSCTAPRRPSGWKAARSAAVGAGRRGGRGGEKDERCSYRRGASALHAYSRGWALNAVRLKAIVPLQAGRRLFKFSVAWLCISRVAWQVDGLCMSQRTVPARAARARAPSERAVPAPVAFAGARGFDSLFATEARQGLSWCPVALLLLTTICVRHFEGREQKPMPGPRKPRPHGLRSSPLERANIAVGSREWPIWGGRRDTIETGAMDQPRAPPLKQRCSPLWRVWPPLWWWRFARVATLAKQTKRER